jgi:hypothetical protein
MHSPSGSEQILSLAWALEAVADFSPEAAIQALCATAGLRRADWALRVDDPGWFIGDRDREDLEKNWNERFATRTGVWLHEDDWHLPLWQRWLPHPKMVFAANLEYLIKRGKHGTVTELAKFTSRDRTTVSKWGDWKKQGLKVRLPPRPLLPKILAFFDLPATVDLSAEPLFLGRAAIKDVMLRNQGKHFLECLSGEYLRQAVERLREESLRQSAYRHRQDGRQLPMVADQEGGAGDGS